MEAATSRSGRSSTTVGGLTFANLAASASTYFVFVVAERVLAMPNVVGTYVTAWAVVTLIVMVVDGGDGLLSARNSIVGEPELALAAGARRRVVVSALSGAIVAVALVLADPVLAAVGAVVAVLTSVQNFLLAGSQARERWSLTIAAQMLNAAGFAVAALVVIREGGSAAAALSVHAWGTLPSIVLLAYGQRSVLVRALRPVRDPGADRTVRTEYLLMTLLGAAVTQLDVAGLGVLSAVVVADYALVQKPAAALLALTASLHRFALPRLGSATSQERSAWLARTRTLVIAALPVALLGTAIAALILPVVYGRDLSTTLLVVLWLVLAAYVVDLAAVVPLNLLLLDGAPSRISRTLVAVLLLLALGVALGAVVGLVWLAVALFAGRVLLWWATRRAARENLETAS